MRVVVVHPSRPAVQPEQRILRGPCRVVDGDTIVIDKVHIRLAGIDAPELDHPWGQKAKWALVALCRGQVVTARITPEMSYNRLVARCFLPDGRDLAAEMVRAGLALDWPKFSGGRYRHLEPIDVRKKLWRASLRQSGLLWPDDEMVAKPFAAPRAVPPPRPLPPARRAGAPSALRSQASNARARLFVIPGILVLLVGFLMAGNADRDVADVARSEIVRTSGVSAASLLVTADVLNVRESPGTGAGIIAQLRRGAQVTSSRMSGSWYGIELGGGRMGWVHGNFLTRIGEPPAPVRP